MNYQFVRCLLGITLVLCAQISVWGRSGNAGYISEASEDVILQWNRVLRETIRTPGQHPATIMPVRSYAMMHAAMFDAVNSIEPRYQPYLV